MPYVPTNTGGGVGFDDCETDRDFYWRLMFYVVLFTAIMAALLASTGAWQAAMALALIGSLVVLFLRRCIKREEMKETQPRHALALSDKRP